MMRVLRSREHFSVTHFSVFSFRGLAAWRESDCCFGATLFLRLLISRFSPCFLGVSQGRRHPGSTQDGPSLTQARPRMNPGTPLVASLCTIAALVSAGRVNRLLLTSNFLILALLVRHQSLLTQQMPCQTALSINIRYYIDTGDDAPAKMAVGGPLATTFGRPRAGRISPSTDWPTGGLPHHQKHCFAGRKPIFLRAGFRVCRRSVDGALRQRK
jgi:hypothetical protein